MLAMSGSGAVFTFVSFCASVSLSGDRLLDRRLLAVNQDIGITILSRFNSHSIRVIATKENCCVFIKLFVYNEIGSPVQHELNRS